MAGINKHLVVQLSVAVGLCVIGCGLLIAGFVVAPLGIIDHSILVAFGEICTFAGGLFGLDYKHKKDKELDVNND